MEQRERYRIALKIEYDGTNFNGWQIQSVGRTIQQTFEDAVFKFYREKIPVVASGRTDTGVHATGQIIHLDVPKGRSLDSICSGLNSYLPLDVSVINCYEVSPNFHARFDACEREYKFLIYNNPFRSVVWQDRALFVKDPIDLKLLKRTLSFFVGEHDFASFCKKRSSDGNTVRTIKNIDVNVNSDIIEVYITGSGFLHNMIRIIIGTTLEINKNRVSPDVVQKMLIDVDRDSAGQTVSPVGLYLNRVSYVPSLLEMNSAV